MPDGKVFLFPALDNLPNIIPEPYTMNNGTICDGESRITENWALAEILVDDSTQGKMMFVMRWLYGKTPMTGVFTVRTLTDVHRIRRMAKAYRLPFYCDAAKFARYTAQMLMANKSFVSTRIVPELPPEGSKIFSEGGADND